MQTDNKIISELQNILNNNRLAHAYLFEGGNKNQRHDMALFLVKSQFCENLQDGLPCGVCTMCQNIDLGDNPDVLEIDTEKRSIGVDDVKTYKNSMARSATQGNIRALIINDAQKMTPQAANNLLKFIEEPEGNVLIILLADSKNQILPTILSRVQSFSLSDEHSDNFADVLKEKGFTDKNIRIISAATELKNVEELTNEDFDNFLAAELDWFKKCLTGDMQAFINVQSQLKSLADNRLKQDLFWSILEKMFSDELSFRYNLDKELILTSEINANKSSQQLTTMIDMYLESVKKWKSNVAFQACVESLTLNLIGG